MRPPFHTLNRVNNLTTVVGCHSPLRGVRMPRRFSSSAILGTLVSLGHVCPLLGPVRRQRPEDRLRDFPEGGFLVHRSHKGEDEAESRAGQSARRTSQIVPRLHDRNALKADAPPLRFWKC